MNPSHLLRCPRRAAAPAAIAQGKMAAATYEALGSSTAEVCQHLARAAGRRQPHGPRAYDAPPASWMLGPCSRWIGPTEAPGATRAASRHQQHLADHLRSMISVRASAAWAKGKACEW